MTVLTRAEFVATYGPLCVPEHVECLDPLSQFLACKQGAFAVVFKGGDLAHLGLLVKAPGTSAAESLTLMRKFREWAVQKGLNTITFYGTPYGLASTIAHYLQAQAQEGDEYDNGEKAIFYRAELKNRRFDHG